METFKKLALITSVTLAAIWVSGQLCQAESPWDVEWFVGPDFEQVDGAAILAQQVCVDGVCYPAATFAPVFADDTPAAVAPPATSTPCACSCHQTSVVRYRVVETHHTHSMVGHSVAAGDRWYLGKFLQRVRARVRANRMARMNARRSMMGH